MIVLVDKVVYQLGFLYVIVGDFVHQLGFVCRSLHFEMFEVVEVFVCNIFVYMVQKDLVENNNHHQMINSLYDRVFVVYFYFVEKMGNLRYDPVKDVDNLGNLLSWLMDLEDFNIENIHDSACLFEEVDLFLMDLRNYNCVLQNSFS